MTVPSVTQLNPSSTLNHRHKPSDPLAHLLVHLDDTILWDPQTLEYALVGEPRRGRPHVCSAFMRVQLYRLVMVRGKSVDVVIPDVLLAQLVWGARTATTPWPKRWRQKLRALPPFKGKWTGEDGECPTGCPIHGHGVPHGHFQFHKSDADFLGQVARLVGPKDAKTGAAPLDYRNWKNVKGLRAVYLLPVLFAATPKSKIAPRQGLLLSRLVGQTTRTRARVLQTRLDKAQVFTATGGELAADDNREYQLADCPFLAKGERYVAFNGNRTEGGMKNKPHGYGLKVETRAQEAGYPSVAEYLEALKELMSPFDLVAGGYEPNTRTWYTLDQLKALGEAAGDFLLRVYAPADYREQWRATFYGWLGFDPLQAAVRVASGADVKRARKRGAQKGKAKAEAPVPAAPNAAPAVPTPAPPPPSAPLQRPDLVKVRADFAALVADVEARTKNTDAAQLETVRYSLVGRANLPGFAKYVAILKLAPVWWDVFIDRARADYHAFPTEWFEFLQEEAQKDVPDGHIRRAVARFAPPALSGAERAPSSSIPASSAPATGTALTTAPSPTPRPPAPPPAPTAAVTPPAAPALDLVRIRSDYEALLAKALSRVGGKMGMGRRFVLQLVLGARESFAVIRYAVALLIEPEIAETHLDQARDEYAAEPELWGRFLNEQAEKDGPDSPLRAAAQRLAER